MDYKDVVAGIDLRVVLTPGKRFSGERPVMDHCRWHEDRRESLAIYRDHFHCFGCGAHKSTLEWIAEQEHVDIETDFKKVVEAAAARYGHGVSQPLPPPRVIESKRLLPLNPAVAQQHHATLGVKRRWYLNRGLTDKTIDSQLLGYDGRAYTIPVWHPSGQLLTIRFRRDDSLGTGGPKYWGTVGRNDTMLYNQVALHGARVVVISEGEFDCLLLWQEGVAAVSSTNGAKGMATIWPRVKNLFRCERIIIALDQDEAGRKAATELKAMVCGNNRRSLDRNRAVILQWDASLGIDITDLVGKMGTEYLKKLIREVL